MKLFHHQLNVASITSIASVAITSTIGTILANLFCLTCLYSVYADPISSSTPFSVSIDAGIELSVPSTLEMPITPSTNGTYSSKPLNIAVSTNNITGYTLTMHNDSSNLVHNSDSTITIPTLDNAVDKSSFPLNKWGYSLDDITYNPIPTNTDTTLKTTNTHGNADTTTINLATKVDLTKPAGTYTNTFVFNAVANHPATVTITWDANEGTVSPTTSNIEYGTAIGTLPVPTRDGHNFLGWFTAASGGTEVTPETRVTADATYYAHWEEATVTFDQAFANAGAEKLNGYYKMQDMTTEICNSITPALDTTVIGTQITTLIDIRDNNTYTVAKLLDGNCWMTKNLALGETNPITLTPDDSNVVSNWVLPAHREDIWQCGPDEWCDRTFTYDDGPSIFNRKLASDTWEDYYDGENVPDENVGVYYNYETVSASSYRENDITPYSVCPKGWRLPTGYKDNDKPMGEFTELISKYNINFQLPPLSFVKSGVYLPEEDLYHSSSLISLWTSNMAGDYQYYSLYIDNGNFDLYSLMVDQGLPVRCIAR